MTRVSGRCRAAIVALAVLAWASLAVGQSVTLSTATRALDPAGGRITFSAEVSYPGEAGYELAVELPRGWEYVGGEGEPAARPFVGAQVRLEWSDHAEARAPGRIAFTVRYPAGVVSASVMPRLALTRRLSSPPRLPFPPWEVFVRTDGVPINFGPAVAPSIRYQPVNRTVGVEGVAWISVAAEGTAPLRYQWRKDGRPIAGATTAIHSIFPATLADAGTFDVVVSNAVGSVTSRAAMLTVKNGNPGQAAPVIDAQPLDVSTTAGGLAVFGVVAFSNHLVSYQWQRNGSDIAGATGQSLVLPNVQAADAGAYAVVVRNAFGATRSRAAVLEVGPAWTGGEPPRIVEQPVGFERVVSDAGELRVVAGGSPPLRYQWFHYGVPVPGATRETLQLDQAGWPLNGNYSVVVSNGLGAVRSRTAVVRLLSTDLGPPTERSTQAERVVVGERATLTAPATGSPPHSFQWFKGDAAIPAATGATLTFPAVAATDAGIYRAVVASLLGSSLHLAELIVEPESAARPPVFRGPFSGATISVESPVSLGGGVEGTGPLRYQWLKNGRELPGATEARLTIAAAQFSDAGEYALRAANVAGTAVSDAMRLEVRGPGGAFALAGPSGIPALVTQPREASVAEGGSVGFHVTVRAEVAPWSYQWRKNGVAIPGATDAVYLVARAVREDSGYYSVVVWNARGATVSEAARLAVGPADPRAAEEAGRRRLRNVSTRAMTANGEAAMTAGFVVAGEGTLPVLVRAIGPTLGTFGVAGALGGARVEVFRDEAPVAVGAEWSGEGGGARVAAAAQRVGAFALPARSGDAALLLNLESGGYTARVTGGDGVALVEVYDAREDEAALAPRLINLATRGRTGVGERTLTAGFVITGPSAKRVLVRGVGPGLGAFGVSEAIADPQVRLFAGSNLVATNDDWEDGENAADVAVLGAQAGAFALAAGSKDAALVAELAPGAYTVQVSGAGESSGVALVEIYEVR